MRHFLRLLLPLAVFVACGACARRQHLPRVVAPATQPTAAPTIAAPLAPVVPPANGRLPTTAVPRGYDLSLTVDPAAAGFSGRVRIEVELLEPTEDVLIHGQGLSVHSVEVQTADGATLTARWETVDPATGLSAVRLPRALPPGTVTMTLAYDASFADGLRGLYRVDRGGAHYAFTQLEATWARLVFPCFDEPGFKAPFTVAVTVPEGARAFANAPAVADQPAAPGWRTVRFAPTPPMPTYLVALAVGPFDVVEAPPVPASEVRPEPLPLRGIAARGRGAELAYALAHTGAILASLERYFGSPYPYAKLDLVAVPDFGAGAMENAGLVTFREALLLLGADAPEWQRRAFVSVTAHELAHMWFGDLVTMRWWDDLWLNEAMATWQANRTVEELHPEYHAELDALAATHRAMDADSLATARRVREPIVSAHDIHAAFDAITYEKGAAVLYMVEAWVGSDAFRDGIRRYLARHAWGNATTDDLVASLSGAARRDLGPVFQSFLDQPGVPFVDARLGCEGRRAALALRERRYLPLGSTGAIGMRWVLPFCAQAGPEEAPASSCVLLDGSEGELVLHSRTCPAWVVPNADGAGYFRFAFDDAVRAAMRPDRFARLEAATQLVLADSLEAAFRGGSIAAGPLLDSLGPLAASEVREVTVAPMDVLAMILDRLLEPAQRGAARAYGRRLYRARYARLGWEETDSAPGAGERELLRAAVVRFMARVAEDPRARAEALRRAEAFLPADGPPHPEAVAPALLGTALAVGVQDGGAAYFDRLMAALHGSEDSLFRVRALSALGAARAPALAARARALALDPELRLSEVLVPLRAQLAQPETRADAWAFVLAHLDALVARLGSRADHLPSLGRALCSTEDAARLEEAFAPRVDAWPSGPRALAGALELIRLCAALVEAQAPSARRYFTR